MFPKIHNLHKIHKMHNSLLKHNLPMTQCIVQDSFQWTNVLTTALSEWGNILKVEMGRRDDKKWCDMQQKLWIEIVSFTQILFFFNEASTVSRSTRKEDRIELKPG